MDIHHSQVAIIGGGLAGLTTAYRLKMKGIQVDVFEARARVGGRVFTVTLQGHVGELGGQNIRDGGDAAHILNLTSELHLPLEKEDSSMALFYYESA